MGNHWAKRWRQDAICSDVAIVSDTWPQQNAIHEVGTKALEFGTQMSSGYLSVQAGSKFEMQLFTLHHLDQRGPGSAATLPQGQLRPYPCQGSAATLPTRILWKGQRFLPLSRVSCDPTWPQCKESYRFSHCFEVIQVQVQHSFYQFFPPLLATHAFNDWFFPSPGKPMLSMIQGSRATFLLSIFPPPLATHAFNDSGSNTTFLLSKIFPPLATHAFNDSSSSTTFFLSIFSPHPLATHALRPYLTTFRSSNFPPPWQPMLSMIQVQVQHSF